MTRQHNQQTHCGSCGAITTTETAFGRWIRNNASLDSVKHHIVVQDQDYWIHKYKAGGSRLLKLLVGVEVKTMGAELTEPQRDLLHILNQLIRNRNQTPNKRLKWQAGNGINVVYSLLNRCDVRVRSFGMHVLTFSALGPDDSASIRWDGTEIDAQILTQILNFDLDPDTLKPLDLKPHHQTHESKVLPLFFQNTMRRD